MAVAIIVTRIDVFISTSWAAFLHADRYGNGNAGARAMRLKRKDLVG
jgi:hypothetical protein